MSSFYGNAAIGGGEGTTNYNDLANRPIVNIEGIIAPVNLGSLAVGTYNVKGKYRYSESDNDIKNWEYQNIVRIFNDAITDNHIARFDVYENDNRYTYTIITKPDNNYEVQKYAYDMVNADFSSALPEEGEINKIYSTGDGIYVYVNGEYRQLGINEEQSWSPIN